MLTILLPLILFPVVSSNTIYADRSRFGSARVYLRDHPAGGGQSNLRPVRSELSGKFEVLPNDTVQPGIPKAASIPSPNPQLGKPPNEPPFIGVNGIGNHGRDGHDNTPASQPLDLHSSAAGNGFPLEVTQIIPTLAHASSIATLPSSKDPLQSPPVVIKPPPAPTKAAVSSIENIPHSVSQTPPVIVEPTAPKSRRPIGDSRLGPSVPAHSQTSLTAPVAVSIPPPASAPTVTVGSAAPGSASPISVASRPPDSHSSEPEVSITTSRVIGPSASGSSSDINGTPSNSALTSKPSMTRFGTPGLSSSSHVDSSATEKSLTGSLSSIFNSQSTASIETITRTTVFTSSSSPTHQSISVAQVPGSSPDSGLPASTISPVLSTPSQRPSISSQIAQPSETVIPKPSISIISISQPSFSITVGSTTTIVNSPSTSTVYRTNSTTPTYTITFPFPTSSTSHLSTTTISNNTTVSSTSTVAPPAPTTSSFASGTETSPPSTSTDAPPSTVQTLPSSTQTSPPGTGTPSSSASPPSSNTSDTSTSGATPPVSEPSSSAPSSTTNGQSTSSSPASGSSSAPSDTTVVTNPLSTVTISGPVSGTSTLSLPSSIFPNDTSIALSSTVAIPSPSPTSILSIITFSTPTNSQLSFVTATTLVQASTPTTSSSDTLSDPDAPMTTTSVSVLTGTKQTASPTQPSIPSTLPTRILPNANQFPQSSTTGQDQSLISILFSLTLNWPFVNENTQTQGQIFLFMPGIIAAALNIDVSQVVTYALQVQIPQGWNGSNPAKLGTIYLAFIPTELVPILTQMVREPTSPLYQLSGVPGELANQFVPSFPIQSVNLNSVPGMATSSNSSNSSKTTRRDALIGVCSAVGIFAGLVLVWWIVRYYQRKNEEKHRQLNEFTDPNWSGGVYGTHNDHRRTSFYYAEDQLHAGYDSVPYNAVPSRAASPVPVLYSPTSPPPGSIGANALQGGPVHVPARRRSNMRQVSISAPVLQFSSIDC